MLLQLLLFYFNGFQIFVTRECIIQFATTLNE